MTAQLSPEAAVLLDAAARERRRRDPVWAAKMGMFSTCDRIDEAKGYDGVRLARPADPVLVADAQTSMCDYRLALSIALGRTCDRNGYAS